MTLLNCSVRFKNSNIPCLLMPNKLHFVGTKDQARELTILLGSLMDDIGTVTLPWTGIEGNVRQVHVELHKYARLGEVVAQYRIERQGNAYDLQLELIALGSDELSIVTKRLNKELPGLFKTQYAS